MKKDALIILVLICIFIPTAALAANGASSISVSPEPQVLTLDQCLKLAFDNSQSLKAASESVAKAREQVKVAQAGYYPSLNYQLGYQKLNEAPIVGWPGGMPRYGVDQGVGANITVTQPLYTAGKLTNALKLAQLQLDNLLQDERKVKQQLTYNVKEAYYQVWLAAKMLTVARDSLDVMDHHVEQVQKFKQVGTASKYDLNRAQVQRDTLKPSVIKAQNGLALAKLGLAILVGLDKDIQFEVSYDPSQLKLPGKVDIGINALLGEAYANRPELRQIQQYKQVTAYKTALAEANYKPNLVLTGTWQGQGGNLDFDNWQKTWNITLAVTGNLYNGGATKAQVNAAQKDEQIAAANEAQLKDKIRLDVQQALQTLQENLETIRANEANMGLAKDTLKNTQTRFDAGLATTMDIMDSQLALDQAENGYYQGIAAYLTTLAKLDLVKGSDK